MARTLWRRCRLGSRVELNNNLRKPRLKMKQESNLALLVRLEAKAGKEAETEQFLKAGLSIAQEEAGTTTWFALKLGPSTFGIFDTFVDESGREAHLSGRLAAALMQKAPELLAEPPTIEKVGVLAAKVP